MSSFIDPARRLASHPYLQDISPLPKIWTIEEVFSQKGDVPDALFRSVFGSVLLTFSNHEPYTDMLWIGCNLITLSIQKIRMRNSERSIEREQVDEQYRGEYVSNGRAQLVALLCHIT